MIIREWKCSDCGSLFESSEPPEEVECPACSKSEPERVFLTAPGLKSPKTSIADREIRGLAADYGLSDVSNKYGEAVKKPASENPGQFMTGSPQGMQILSRLGPNSDGFSPLLPAIRAAGGPRTWERTPLKQRSSK